MNITGEYNVILDDKNRIILPAQLRRDIDVLTVVIAKGQDRCLWVYTKAKWEEKIASVIKENTDPFAKKDRRLLRKFGASQVVEIDKLGRMLVAENLRNYAGLSRDCVILGQFDYMEIWDETRYNDFCDEENEENAQELNEASEELSQRIKRKKGTID